MATSWNVFIEIFNDASTSLKAKTLLARCPNTSFITPLTYYQSILEHIDPVMFPYLFSDNQTANSRTNIKRNQLKYDLELTRLLLATQAAYELQNQKYENLLKYNNQINICTLYIKALSSKEAALQVTRESIDEANYAAKYLRFTLGLELANQMSELVKTKTESQTKYIAHVMGAVNGKRLYWIWGSSLLKTVLSLLPNEFYNVQQAGKIVCLPDPYTGCLSWSLYFARFAMNFALLLKHVLPWSLTKEELELSWTERFKLQWEYRKFTLLNDSLWGIANLFCAVWLTGSAVLGAAGDALTVVLLAFDVGVSIWDFKEQKEGYLAEIKKFNEDIQSIEEQIKKAKNSNDKKTLLEFHLANLIKARAISEKRWELNKLNLYNSLAYAAGLMLAFVVFTLPFMPVPAVPAMILGVVGAALCFGFTVINNALKIGFELYQTKVELSKTKKSFAELIELLENLFKTNPNRNDNEKRFLFLEIKKLQATSEYQRHLVQFQTLGLVRHTIIELIVPTVIFSSLVFLPLGMGLAALGCALGLAIGSHWLINYFYEPDEDMKKLPDFNEHEYLEFSNLALKKERAPTEYYGFFNRKFDHQEKLVLEHDTAQIQQLGY